MLTRDTSAIMELNINSTHVSFTPGEISKALSNPFKNLRTSGYTKVLAIWDVHERERLSEKEEQVSSGMLYVHLRTCVYILYKQVPSRYLRSDLLRPYILFFPPWSGGKDLSIDNRAFVGRCGGW